MWVQNDIVNAIGLKEGNNKQKSFIHIPDVPEFCLERQGMNKERGKGWVRLIIF